MIRTKLLESSKLQWMLNVSTSPDSSSQWLDGNASIVVDYNKEGFEYAID
jgi:hypothetical protein